MTVKAIVFDLDRTLLHTDKSISEYTLGILRECRKSGMLILAATARPVRNVTEYDKMIGFDAFSALNGAAVVLPTGTVEHHIKGEDAYSVLCKLTDDPDTVVSAETSDGFFANTDIPAWAPIIYEGFPDLPTEGRVYKIIVSNPHTDILPKVRSALTDGTYCTVANGSLVQIMSREATKMNGIVAMLCHFGVDAGDAVYFGDDFDDVEPIRRCGLGVAVANAIPEVKSASDAITDSNDEDGVARYIEKHLLRK